MKRTVSVSITVPTKFQVGADETMRIKKRTKRGNWTKRQIVLPVPVWRRIGSAPAGAVQTNVLQKVLVVNIYVKGTGTYSLWTTFVRRYRMVWYQDIIESVSYPDS